MATTLNKGHLKVQVTNVFQRNYEANTRYVINQGGTRSSKTYSLCQWLLYYSLNNTKKVISIVRKTLPALKSSALRDFKEVFDSAGQWDDNNFNKSELQYTHNGNVIEFFSIDNQQKVRGRKRDILWINEANEIEHEDFLQLNVRTSERVMIDINPSDEFSWIYNLIENENTKNDSTFIKSTYKDNPFLDDNVIKAIESESTNEEWYKVFGLGERAVKKETIYTNWREHTFPETDTFSYGLDFGYNHPTSLTQTCEIENDVYVKEIIYQSWLTPDALVTMINESNLDKSKLIYCDSARPDLIATIVEAGYNAVKSNKEVKAGISYIQNKRINVHPGGTNIKRELTMYSWKKNNAGIFLEEPIKLNDDAMDSMRYSIYTSKNSNNFEAYGIY